MDVWLNWAGTVAFLVHLEQRCFSLTFFDFRGFQNSHSLHGVIVLVTWWWQNERLLLILFQTSCGSFRWFRWFGRFCAILIIWVSFRTLTMSRTNSFHLLIHKSLLLQLQHRGLQWCIFATRLSSTCQESSNGLWLHVWQIGRQVLLLDHKVVWRIWLLPIWTAWHCTVLKVTRCATCRWNSNELWTITLSMIVSFNTSLYILSPEKQLWIAALIRRLSLRRRWYRWDINSIVIFLGTAINLSYGRRVASLISIVWGASVGTNELDVLQRDLFGFLGGALLLILVRSFFCEFSLVWDLHGRWPSSVVGVMLLCEVVVDVWCGGWVLVIGWCSGLVIDHCGLTVAILCTLWQSDKAWHWFTCTY